MTNVLYMFVHWKETSAGRSNMSWQRNLPNRKEKPGRTSSQAQTPADLKHKQRHYCMLFSLGFPLPTSVCRATPKWHKFKRQHRDQCVLSHVKDFLLLIMPRLWNGGGVMGGDRGWSQEHYTARWNVRLLQVISLSKCLFLKKKGKRKKERRRFDSTNHNKGATVKPSAHWWCGDTHKSAPECNLCIDSHLLILLLFITWWIFNLNNDEQIYSNVNSSLKKCLGKYTHRPFQYMHMYFALLYVACLLHRIAIGLFLNIVSAALKSMTYFL